MVIGGVIDDWSAVMSGTAVRGMKVGIACFAFQSAITQLLKVV